MVSKEELIQLVCDVTGTEEKVEDTTNLDELGWDSLTTLDFIAKLDSQYGLNIRSESLGNAKTVQDVIGQVNQGE